MYTMRADELMSLNIQEVLNSIHSASRISLSELRLFDLLSNENGDRALRHGVYMFFDEMGECVYVGMCSSSHFAHRLGGHFGMSPKYGMNTFLRRVIKKDLRLDTTKYESYVEALPKISNYSLLIIDASGTGKKFVRRLERLLHTILAPRLNFPKGLPKTYAPLDLETSFEMAVS